jgi:hypothetical protein
MLFWLYVATFWLDNFNNSAEYRILTKVYILSKKLKSMLMVKSKFYNMCEKSICYIDLIDFQNWNKYHEIK